MVKITINVSDTSGNSLTFSAEPTVKLGRLMSDYCARVGKATGTVRFYYDGKQVSTEQTPNDLGMQEGEGYTLQAE